MVALPGLGLLGLGVAQQHQAHGSSIDFSWHGQSSMSLAQGGRGRAGSREDRKRERVRAGGLRADLVRRDHGGGARARAAHLRSRRRCLRDRRGLAGLTTAREIARRGWSVAVLEAHRIAWNASGRNDRLRAARASPSHGRHRRAASGSITPRRCGRCRRSGSNTCAAPSPRPRMPGVAPTSRLAEGLQGRQRDEISRCVQLYRPGFRRRHRSLADRARARGAPEQALFPRDALAAARSTSIRSTTRSGSRPRRKRPARAFSRRRRRSRSIPTACASASPRRPRACAPPCRARRQRPSRRR